LRAVTVAGVKFRRAFAITAILALNATASAHAASPYAGHFETSVNSYTFEQAPDWMPGGKRVLSYRDLGDGTKNQVYTSRLDGSDELCLTCGLQGPNMVPTAQPGGDWVLFHSWNGHQLTVGAPGYGGMGSDLWAVRSDGSGEPVRLTTSSEGHDNFHAYWSPDGKWIVWTQLNWNAVTENGNGDSDVRVARFRTNGPKGPRLTGEHVVRPANGHWYETQWWAPDGSGFLYTESTGDSLNNELYFCRLPDKAGECEPVRLTDNPAWDEQAIFTPDMKRIVFMSTRDHPGAFNDYEQVAQLLGLPADYDYALVLPVFYFGFLQPVFQQANDLYDFKVTRSDGEISGAGEVRRLTTSGDQGWVKPEFSFDDSGRRLLFTQVRINDGVRIDQRLDLVAELQQAASFLEDPSQAGESQFQVGIPTEKQTLIGRFAGR
jgi:Tol biopolymer transport system component